MLIYRRRHPEKTPDAESPLRFHVQAALQQVTDQIWLLKNVGWWGLWPMFAVSAVLVGRIGWKDWRRGDHSALIVLPVLLVFGAACWAVHWLNQNAIRKEFEPRRRELETLLSSFEVEPPEISPPPSP